MCKEGQVWPGKLNATAEAGTVSLDGMQLPGSRNTVTTNGAGRYPRSRFGNWKNTKKGKKRKEKKTWKMLSFYEAPQTESVKKR